MRFVGATIATTGALLIVSPASAYAVSGYFCSGAYLTPGNACGHSPQHEFADVYGYNSGNAVPEICAGVSNTAAGNPPKRFVAQLQLLVVRRHGRSLHV